MKREEKQGLSVRERRFCAQYLQLRDEAEAARRAGYAESTAQRRGMELLLRPDIREELSRQEANGAEPLRRKALAGLRRLAFGGSGALLQMVQGEEGVELRLGELDPFRVSELKVRRGGDVEVKFYDRQRALEKLWELEEEETGGGNALYEALERSARELGQKPEEK